MSAPLSTRSVPPAFVVLTCVLLGLRLFVGVVEARQSKAATLLVGWLDAAGAEAATSPSGQALLYDFSASWCAPCRSMDREVFARPENARFVAAAFVPVRVDLTLAGDEAAEELQERFQVDRLPTLLVVRDGLVTGRQTGYKDAETTLRFLREQASAPQP